MVRSKKRIRGRVNQSHKDDLARAVVRVWVGKLIDGALTSIEGAIVGGSVVIVSTVIGVVRF